jgi:hypothetical protein
MGRIGSRFGREHDCVVLDLQSNCVLRESLDGYRAALGNDNYYIVEGAIDSWWRSRIVIVPGLGRMNPDLAQKLRDAVERGMHLLLESGAGFLSPAEFVTHQRMLRQCFDLVVESPVDLWSRSSDRETRFAHHGPRPDRNQANRREAIPYVDYIWPRETRVRDFSQVIPVWPEQGDVIGRVGSLPVAMKKRVGRGTLIFLGSALGPALRAGDPEARSWARVVTERG